MAQATDDTIANHAPPTPIPTALNVTALAKRFGVARSTIQRRLKKGWTPPAKVLRKPSKAAPDATPRAAPDAAPAIVSVPQHWVSQAL